jgi:hypothetical protein
MRNKFLFHLFFKPRGKGKNLFIFMFSLRFNSSAVTKAAHVYNAFCELIYISDQHRLQNK